MKTQLLEEAMEEAIRAERVVGSVVVVLKDGEVVYRRAAGQADRETATPMREDTVFRLASVTKPIVTVAALRLVEQGRLSLDAPVTEFLPEFRPRLADGSAPEILVRQLLTHTSGLSYGHMQPSDGSYRRENVSDGLDQPGLPMAEELRRITASGLGFAPGTAFMYSVGIDVLGAAMERATSTPLPRLVRDLVTGPLELRDTDFAPPNRERLATPYADGTPPVRMGDPHVVPFFDLSGIWYSPSRAFDTGSFPSGGAGMNGTADDVARFLEAVRTGRAGLGAETTRDMMSNQTGTLPIVLGPGFGFGFGGAVLVDPAAAASPQTRGTWTWGGAWGHNWFVDPAKGLVVVGLTNTAIEGMMGRFPAAVRDAVYAAL